MDEIDPPQPTPETRSASGSVQQLSSQTPSTSLSSDVSTTPGIDVQASFNSQLQASILNSAGELAGDTNDTVIREQVLDVSNNDDEMSLDGDSDGSGHLLGGAAPRGPKAS